MPQGLCTICLSTTSSAAFRAAPDVSAAASFLVPLAHAATGSVSSFPVRGARAAAKRERGGGLKDAVEFFGGEAVVEGAEENLEEDVEIDDPASSRSGAHNKPFREEDFTADIPVSAAPTLYVISQPRGCSSLDDEITHSTISYTASGVSIADVQDIALALTTLVSAPPAPLSKPDSKLQRVTD